MSLESITALIIQYKYLVLIPLSMLEGPVVAFAAGTLASLGYFNVYVLALFFFTRDMLMDGLYYALGHYGNRTVLAHKILKRIGVQPEHLEEVRMFWERRAFTTMFFGKLSYGVASSFIVVAGAVGMPLKKFFGWGAVVAMLQYGVLLVLGYFFGVSLGGKADVIINNVQYIIGGISVVAVLYYIASRYARTRVMKKE